MDEIKKLAWFGDPDLKEQVLQRMKQHRAQDSIVQGEYQTFAPELATKYRGCLLGCTLPRAVDRDIPEGRPGYRWHNRVEELYGISTRVSYLLETIFEGLPFEDAADFAVESIEAIPVGADLSEVANYWLFCEVDEDVEPAKDTVLTLLRNAPVPGSTQ